MSWISPELIEILLTILKAVVILLVVVACGHSRLWRRHLLGLFQNRYGPTVLAGAVRSSWSRTYQNVL
ncbi:hypothetical protein ACVXHB_24730 [Escherichia coli]